MTIVSLLYFGMIALWSAFVAHFVLENFFPVKKRIVHVEGPVPAAPVEDLSIYDLPIPPQEPAPLSTPAVRTSMNEGFKAFQQGAELTVEDIVKGLSRQG
jgi:hypothetical protein